MVNATPSSRADHPKELTSCQLWLNNESQLKEKQMRLERRSIALKTKGF